MPMPARKRVVVITFEAIIDLEDDRAELQSRAFAQYIQREVTEKSIEPNRGESFQVLDTYVAELPKGKK